MLAEFIKASLFVVLKRERERESDLRAFWLDLGWKMFQAEDTTSLKGIATFPIAKPTNVKRESLKKAMG